MYINMERKINLHSSVRSNSAMIIEVASVSEMSVVERETTLIKDEPTLKIAHEVEQICTDVTTVTILLP